MYISRVYLWDGKLSWHASPTGFPKLGRKDTQVAEIAKVGWDVPVGLWKPTTRLFFPLQHIIIILLLVFHLSSSVILALVPDEVQDWLYILIYTQTGVGGGCATRLILRVSAANRFSIQFLIYVFRVFSAYSDKNRHLCSVTLSYVTYPQTPTTV